jgi:hypothetical protein
MTLAICRKGKVDLLILVTQRGGKMKKRSNGQAHGTFAFGEAHFHLLAASVLVPQYGGLTQYGPL